jgi:phosphatidylglycerol lysyltransferase
VLELLRRHGFNTTSFQALEDGLVTWWDPRGDACVAYADTKSAWIAAGAPIARPAEIADVAERFVEAGRQAGKRVAFFASQARMAGIGALESTLVGLQPVWDPRAWSDNVSRSRSMRAQINRAQAKSVVVRRVDPRELSDASAPARRAIEQLIERWLASRRMSPMGFLVHVQPFDFAEERRSFVAERDGAIVGFLSAVPVYTRDGWFIEDLLRDPRAPNGTSELLIDAAMRQAASEQSSFVTLGLVPLAGGVPGWMRRIGALTRPLYDFAGLFAFKRKLAPSHWEPVYVTHPRDVPTVVALIDSLRAFAGGTLSSFVVRALIEGPSFVLWVLAALLVPWTLILAFVASPAWFPSRGVQFAWVALDVLICAAMFRLARRFEPRLAMITAVVVTCDALSSCVQAAWWNLPRMHAWWELFVIASGCAAPAFASYVLWRNLKRQRLLARLA